MVDAVAMENFPRRKLVVGLSHVTPFNYVMEFPVKIVQRKMFVSHSFVIVGNSSSGKTFRLKKEM